MPSPPSPPQGPTSTGTTLPPLLSLDEAVQILLVDDQPANLDALEAVLEPTGCRFVLARSADEALLALLNQDFAAIVLDVMMPGMSGFDLATMIRRRQRTQQVPILFLTARMLTAEDELRGYGTGAVDYLTKPIDPQILRAKINVFVELYRKRRALARLNIELQRQIAERQRMGDQLKRANEDLEARVAERTAALAESNRRKDEFLAMLAHELRNPLSALRTASEAMRLTVADNPELQNLQGVFQRQVQQLTRLTNDLLDISRITRDKLILQRRRIAVVEFVDTAVETARPLMERHRHSFTVEQRAGDLQVDGDCARLAQVLSNLLDNAARYSPPETKIRLTTDRDGTAVCIRVTDNGAGIEQDLLPRIFDLFVQGRRAPLSAEGGLGIGLPLARRLVEMHGGTLTAYSGGPGRGSEFSVRLPVLDPLPRPYTPTAEEAQTALPRRRILIVEDNEDSAEMMNLMLTQWGQDTRVANDGTSALDIAEQFQPDIIMLDIGLPRLHGYEVARRLRQKPWGKSALVIAVTGWGLEVDRHGDAAGIDYRLLKPIDPSALRRILHSSTAARS